MQWTAEQDRILAELHAKRLGNTFITKWMRISLADVRARLAELGLAKPPASRSTKGVSIAAPVEVSDLESIGDDEDDDLIVIDGCPRGYLVPEQRIASIYKSIGRGY